MDRDAREEQTETASSPSRHPLAEKVAKSRPPTPSQEPAEKPVPTSSSCDELRNDEVPSSAEPTEDPELVLKTEDDGGGGAVPVVSSSVNIGAGTGYLTR